MVSSIGSAGGMSTDYITQMMNNIFKTLDTNGDGKLDKSEISQALGGSSQNGAGASSLVTALDSDGDGSISQLEFEAGLSKLHQGAHHKHSGNAGDLFKKIDTNGDGSVSEDEFVSNRPKGMSAEQATQMWSRLDTNGTGSLTESQFESAMAGLGPPPGPPPNQGACGDSSGGTSTASVESSSSADDTAQTGSSGSTDVDSILKQLLSAAVNKYLQNVPGYFEPALATCGLTA